MREGKTKPADALHLCVLLRSGQEYISVRAVRWRYSADSLRVFTEDDQLLGEFPTGAVLGCHWQFGRPRSLATIYASWLHGQEEAKKEEGDGMKAYHFLRDDMTANSGDEPPWIVGVPRTWKDGKKKPKLCERGYHASPSWYDALSYAHGSMACVVEISDPVESDATKSVSYTRTLIAAQNIEHELRLWACDCAERALMRERAAGREPDERCWAAIDVARRFARSEATAKELAAAWAAASAAARAAARAAAWAAASAAARAHAWAAAWDAAWAAARDAASDAEEAWQREALNARLDALFVKVTA